MELPREHDVQLEPPIGTCYFKSYNYTLKEIDQFDSPVDVTFYVYVTQVKPTDPDFTVKGGKVYIITEYNGSARTYGLDNVDFGIEDTSDALMLRDQLPIPGSEVRNGDTREYPINFAQTMNMYNNGGNSAFAFSARYNRTFSIVGHIQSKYQPNGWSLDSDVAAGTHDISPVTNGLQIFVTDRLLIAKCRLRLNYRVGNDVVKMVFRNLDLDFSADTMSKAVVG